MSIYGKTLAIVWIAVITFGMMNSVVVSHQKSIEQIDYKHRP